MNKKYKLLQTINEYSKSDDEFEYDPSVEYEKFTAQWLANVIWIHRKEWFEEIKEVKSIYDLKVWDKCFDVTACYDIRQMSYENVPFDNNKIKYWELFLTKEEAQTELQKRKAMATIKKWSHDNDWGYEFEVNYENWDISWDTFENELTTNLSPRYIFTAQFYSDKEVTIRAIKELEPEYKILFNIKQEPVKPEELYICPECEGHFPDEKMNKISQCCTQCAHN